MVGPVSNSHLWQTSVSVMASGGPNTHLRANFNLARGYLCVLTKDRKLKVTVVHIPSGVPAAAECELGQVESGDRTHEAGGCYQTLSPRVTGEGETAVATAFKTAALCQQSHQLPHDSSEQS